MIHLKIFELKISQKCIPTRVARFLLYQHLEKYTRLPQNIPFGHKIYQMAIKIPRPNVHKIYQNLILQDPPKLTQIAIFGLKIYHLATLSPNYLFLWPEHFLAKIET
jgi:hypothetical protein